MRLSGVLLTVAAAGFLLAGCDFGKSASADASSTSASAKPGKSSACIEALGLADLNPLVDADRLRQRAQDKADRLRQLASDVGDKDARAAMLSLADSYIQVQKEHIEDAGVVAKWVRNNLARLDTLRKACT